MKKKQPATSHLREWKIVAENPDPSCCGYYESVMTLGNGLLGLRGAREEAMQGGSSRPMTLMAEVYDRAKCPPGLPATFRSTSRLAALPNPLFIDFDDGTGRLSANPLRVVSDVRTLDMRRGVLERELRCRGRGGRITRIRTSRIVSQARPHLVAMRYSVTPENYSGSVTIYSLTDGSVLYPDNMEHFREASRGSEGGTSWLAVRTLESKLDVAMVSRHVLSCEAELSDAGAGSLAGLALRFDVSRGRTVTLEKTIAIHNSVRSRNPLAAARAEVSAAPGFAVLEREHSAVWAGYWRDSDVEVKGDRIVQTMVRFWVFQLLQAASNNNVSLGLSASIPAKTLSGWGYGGRIFWDTEMYMLPFFSQQYPEIAKSLLVYRLDRMPAARVIARRDGFSGIKFPWESGATGFEECPKWTPLKDGTGRWERWRGAEQQIHVNADVAFGFWRHCLATGDRRFLLGPALEMFVGTARYWASRVREFGRGDSRRYELRWVIGPDEGHQCVHNNVYTNAMARWNLLQAAEFVESAGKGGAARALKVSSGEVASWRDIASRIKINFDPSTGLYEQFDGYFRHPDQSVKQADTLLALHLFPEMRPTDVFRRNFERYYPVTEHGSSLSPCMHVLFALAIGDEARAYEYELQSCLVDGACAPGGVDKGLHAAALGGGWTSVVSGFGGVKVTPECLEVSPRLPRRWRRLAFSIVYRGLRLAFRVEPGRLVITAAPKGKAVPVRVLGEMLRIKPGARVERRLG